MIFSHAFFLNWSTLSGVDFGELGGYTSMTGRKESYTLRSNVYAKQESEASLPCAHFDPITRRHTVYII